VNRDFDGVVQGCHRQHGIGWLYPQIVRAFKVINEHTKKSSVGLAATIFRDGLPDQQIGTCPIRLYSVEVWNAETNELCGGELGYTVGRMYTSLTGFSSHDSAGSVQLAALGQLLCLAGYDTWDLGMDLDYKTRLGARNVPRSEFVHLVKTTRRDHPPNELKCDEMKNCKEIMEGNLM